MRHRSVIMDGLASPEWPVLELNSIVGLGGERGMRVMRTEQMPGAVTPTYILWCPLAGDEVKMHHGTLVWLALNDMAQVPAWGER